MKLCANLDWLFKELPLLDRFPAAKEAGFDAVEFLDPYALNVQEVVSALGLHGLSVALINCPPPNYTGGAPGWAAVPGSRFDNDLRRGLRYGKALSAQHIHLMAGEASGAQAHATFVANLKQAAASAPKQQFTIEPLNPQDRPGYFLDDYDQALAILAEVDAPNVGLQFDTYHAARIHGDVMDVWSRVSNRVVHVQVGQAPKRTAPTDLASFFDQLRSDGYVGWVSAEYDPGPVTTDSLGWMPVD